MSAADDLITWTQHWRLEGGVISCKACKALQLESQKTIDFTHAEGCTVALPTPNPWNALDDICVRIQQT